MTLPLIANLDNKYYYSLPRKLFKYIKLTGSQGPIGDGHTFSTKSDLQDAVDEWASDSTSATETYGDISTWNVSAITDMSSLFKSKTNITSLDLSGWDTSNVTNMAYMFKDCTSLTSLDVSNFDTSSVTNMYGMFYLAKNITSLDVSNWNTGNVTTMQKLFSNCQ